MVPIRSRDFELRGKEMCVCVCVCVRERERAYLLKPSCSGITNSVPRLDFILQPWKTNLSLAQICLDKIQDKFWVRGGPEYEVRDCVISKF